LSHDTGRALGGAYFLSLGAASLFGLTIPTLLHCLKLDPKIAAGRVTLALSDVLAVWFYFNLAAWWL
jgi:magnesium transporter